MPVCNNTLANEVIHEIPIWHSYTFHDLGLVLSAVFGLIALVIATLLILMHATHYLKPYEQRHIIRILLLIPVYSVVSFLSYYYYQHAIYYDILEGCYEAFAISSFFTLLCNYIAPNLHDQKDYFRGLKPKNWFWGVFGLQKCTGGENKGPFRKPRSGLTWFNIIWVGVFQYCFIRVFFTIVAVLAQIGNVYCQDSLSPAFAHVWVEVFESVSVTIAMFCLIQFYIQLREDLAEHRPFLKVLCIKLVIFFSFWQTIIISFISSANGPLQPTKTIAYPDIRVGIPSMLLCIEMAIFAVMHIFAFPWKPYSIKRSYTNPLHEPGTGFSGTGELHYLGFIRAIVDAFNPWDIVKMTARGLRWLFVGVRKRHDDISYQDDDVLAKPANVGYGPVGPTFAATGEGATELRQSKDDSRERGNTFEDDRAGLLKHQGRLAGQQATPSPYTPYAPYAPVGTAGDSLTDLAAPPPPPPQPQRQQHQQQYSRPPPPPAGLGINHHHAAAAAAAAFDAKPSDFPSPDEEDDDDDETSYHPNQGPLAGAARADAGGAVHPARRMEGSDWPLSNEVERVRPPPTYRSQAPPRR